MSFFDSEFVQEEMEEISNLQDKIYKSVFNFPSMGKEDKLEHIEMLENLLAKQKILYTRMTLSDDPKAIKMREEIICQAQKLGFPPNVDLAYVFSNMEKIIGTMKMSLDNSPT